jgi:hopanoid biosynthesis associated protein HpnK
VKNLLTADHKSRKLFTMQRFVIINADDFGLCRAVNTAVEEACRKGVLTSATLMANMPDASEAVEIAKRTPELGVGVHLNLTEGGPISNDKSVDCIRNASGEFAYSASKLAFKSLANKAIRKAIKTELAAQIQWVVDKKIRPTHFDSHKHVHAFPTIFSIVCELAMQFGIGAIRWTFEPAKIGLGFPPSPSDGKKRARILRMMARINRRQDSKFLKNNMLLGIAHTGKIDHNFLRAVTLNLLGPLVEVMTHPGYTDGLDPAKTRLVEQRKLELEALCSERTRNYFDSSGVRLIHYGQIE